MAITTDILNNTDNVSTIGTQLESFDNSVVIPVGKLDADQYAAADIDGVTESLFGSGNMNFLSLQAAQTNEYLASISSGSEGTSFDAGNTPVFLQNASTFEGINAVSASEAPLLGKVGYFNLAQDDGLADGARSFINQAPESRIASIEGADGVNNAKSSALSFHGNQTPVLNDTLSLDGLNGTSGQNGGSGIVQIITVGQDGQDGTNGHDGNGTTIVNIDLGDTLGDVINNTVNEAGDLITTIVNDVTNVLGDTVTNVTDILTTILNGVLGDDGLHIGLNLDVIDTVLGSLNLDIDDTISGALNAGLDLAPVTDVLNNLTGLGIPILADLDLGLGFDIDPSNIVLNLGDINDLGTLVDTLDNLLNPYINLDVADTSEITGVVSGVLDNLGLGDNSLLDAVIQLANDALDPVDGIVTTAENLLQDPLATVSGLLDDPQGTLTDLAGDLAGSLGELNDIPGDISNVLGALDDGLAGLLPALGDNDLIGAITQLAGDALDPVEGIAGTLTDALQDPVGTLTDLATDPTGTLQDLTGDILGNLGELNDIVPDVGNVADALGDTLGDLVPGLEGNSLIDAIVQLTNDTLDPVGGVVETATDILQDPVGTLTDLATDPAGTLQDLTGSLMDSLGELNDIAPDIGDVASALDDSLGSLGDVLGDSINFDLGNVQDLLSNGDSNTGTQIGDALDTVTSWTESIIPDSGGLFDDIVSGIGGEVDSLPEPITSITESLGSLVTNDHSGGGHIIKLGGLFG